jgi:hypothetical protein
MGVKTKVFGKYAWLMFEGFGRIYDEYMAIETDVRLRQEMASMTKELFFLIGFILPCVYCRISYRGFISTEINIDEMLLLKNGGKKLVYRLHNRVTKKLWDQDLEKYAGNDEKLQEIHEKWTKYSITYEEALRTKYPAFDSYRFWNATIVFLALIMCDYREEDSCHIYRFFWVIGRILCRIQSPHPLSLAYAEGLAKTLPLWKSNPTLSDRIDIVWVLKNHVFDVYKWQFSRTRKTFEDICKTAIVGCNSKK